MAPRLNLSFGLIIAVFIPGAVLAVILAPAMYPVDESTAPPPTPLDNLERLWEAAREAAVLSLSLFSLAALLAGIVLDATRYSITWLVSALIRRLRKQRAPYRVANMGKDDTPVFDWIIDNFFRFHQAFANLAIASVVALLYLDGAVWWFTLIAATALAVAAIGTYIDACGALGQRFPEGSE